jgi:heme oxygenase
MSLLPRLRKATSRPHPSLERWLALTAGDLSPAAYVDVLVGSYGIVVPWEAAVRRVDWPELQAQFADRWRAGALAADLAYLGITDPATVAVCRSLPVLEGRGRVLGSCYALEGSKLGMQVVSRHLEAALGLTGGAGYSFFVGQGAVATSVRWRAFVDWMDEQAGGVDAVADDEVVVGAVETFAALDNWFGAALLDVRTHDGDAGRA